MSLPIDFGGSIWFMPTAVWELEPEPAPPNPAGGESPSAAGAPASGTDEAVARRLVFKGYANSVSFHWFPADSLLSRPWAQSRANDADRRRVPEPPLPLDDAPPADDDADPPT